MTKSKNIAHIVLKTVLYLMHISQITINCGKQQLQKLNKETGNRQLFWNLLSANLRKMGLFWIFTNIYPNTPKLPFQKVYCIENPKIFDNFPLITTYLSKQIILQFPTLSSPWFWVLKVRYSTNITPFG